MSKSTMSQDRKPPRIIFCREANVLESAEWEKHFNDEHQCFGPFQIQPFPDASVVVHRHNKEPIHFAVYEVAIKKEQGGTVNAYVYARDWGNFKRFCERVLSVEIIGKDTGEN